MDLGALIIFLLVGGIAGWLASKMMRGAGLGLVGNVVVGIVGAVIGYFVLGMVGLAFGGILGTLVTALLGAVLLLAIVGFFSRRGRVRRW